MIEVNVNVKCPDLLLAATAFAAAIKGTPVPAAASAPTPTASAPAVPYTPQPMPAAPVNPTPAAMPATGAYSAPPIPGPAPTAPAPSFTTQTAYHSSPAVPTASAPSFTLAQVGKAGADLIAANPGKMPELLGLLQQYGVPAVTELKPEQLGPFATALRGLGAKI